MILLPPKGNLPHYHSMVFCGKTYPTTILLFFIKILDNIIPLTWCLSNDTLNPFNNILSPIISTWRLYDENLNSCLLPVIDNIYSVSLSFHTIIHMILSVCSIYLSLFMLKDFPIYVCWRVTILINCDFCNTLL